MSSHFSGDEMDIQCHREGQYKIKMYGKKTQAVEQATLLTPVFGVLCLLRRVGRTRGLV